ncbi:hypothetical protein EON65_44335 [archaeon]|nr:MAG: hypothetical protein EON65_44335 [archaeon]
MASLTTCNNNIDWSRADNKQQEQPLHGAFSEILAMAPLVRALTLGWPTYSLSVRKGETVALNKTLQTLEKGQYIAVIGGKGNGKSCLIDTPV